MPLPLPVGAPLVLKPAAVGDVAVPWRLGLGMAACYYCYYYWMCLGEIVAMIYNF
jgi:hypothetical protein